MHFRTHSNTHLRAQFVLALLLLAGAAWAATWAIMAGPNYEGSVVSKPVGVFFADKGYNWLVPGWRTFGIDPMYNLTAYTSATSGGATWVALSSIYRAWADYVAGGTVSAFYNVSIGGAIGTNAPGALAIAAVQVPQPYSGTVYFHCDVTVPAGEVRRYIAFFNSTFVFRAGYSATSSGGWETTPYITTLTLSPGTYYYVCTVYGKGGSIVAFGTAVVSAPGQGPIGAHYYVRQFAATGDAVYVSMFPSWWADLATTSVTIYSVDASGNPYAGPWQFQFTQANGTVRQYVHAFSAVAVYSTVSSVSIAPLNVPPSVCVVGAPYPVQGDGWKYVHPASIGGAAIARLDSPPLSTAYLQVYAVQPPPRLNFTVVDSLGGSAQCSLPMAQNPLTIRVAYPQGVSLKLDFSSYGTWTYWTSVAQTSLITLSASGVRQGDAVAPHLYDWYISGTGGYIWAPYLSVFNQQPFTVLGGMKQAVTKWDNPLLATGDGGIDRYLHLVVRNCAPYLGFWADDLQGGCYGPGVYLHLAYLWEGPSTRARRIYVNGTVVASGTSTGLLTVTSGAATEYGTWIGRFASYYHYGWISYVHVYGRALSNTEILAALNGVVSASGLAMFLDATFFNGTHYIDLSGNGHHGVSKGSVARVPTNQMWLWVVRGGGSPGYITLRYVPYGARVTVTRSDGVVVFDRTLTDARANAYGLIERYDVPVLAGYTYTVQIQLGAQALDRLSVVVSGVPASGPIFNAPIVIGYGGKAYAGPAVADPSSLARVEMWSLRTGGVAPATFAVTYATPTGVYSPVAQLAGDAIYYYVDRGIIYFNDTPFFPAVAKSIGVRYFLVARPNATSTLYTSVRETYVPLWERGMTYVGVVTTLYSREPMWVDGAVYPQLVSPSGVAVTQIAYPAALLNTLATLYYYNVQSGAWYNATVELAPAVNVVVSGARPPTEVRPIAIPWPPVQAPPAIPLPPLSLSFNAPPVGGIALAIAIFAAAFGAVMRLSMAMILAGAIATVASVFLASPALSAVGLGMIILGIWNKWRQEQQ